MVVRLGEPVEVIVREARDLEAELLVLSWWGTLAGERARAAGAAAPAARVV